jgi:hypothetical protein
MTIRTAPPGRPRGGIRVDSSIGAGLCVPRVAPLPSDAQRSSEINRLVAHLGSSKRTSTGVREVV